MLLLRQQRVDRLVELAQIVVNTDASHRGQSHFSRMAVRRDNVFAKFECRSIARDEHHHVLGGVGGVVSIALRIVAAPTPCDPLPGPVDQCVNDADQSALDALATDELSGPAIVDMIADDCPLNACTSELGSLLSENSPDSRDALANCIASCISDQTGLSIACTGCYGSIAACSTSFCIAPCLPPNSGSPECAACGVENCINLDACTGFD